MKEPRFDDVVVTYATNPSDFYIRRKYQNRLLSLIESKILERAHDLTIHLRKDKGLSDEDLEDSGYLSDNVERLKAQYGLSVGQWILARCRMLHLECPFYRAVIEEPYFNPILGLHLKVKFLDLGIIEWVHVDDTRRFPPELYNFSELASHCSLYMLYPVYRSSSDHTGWSKQAISAFAKLIQSQGNNLSVKIFSSRPGQPTDCDLLCYPDGEPTSVRDLLLFQGHGCLMDPDTILAPVGSSQRPPPKFLDLELGVGTYLTVKVSHVVNPGEIYVQPMSLLGEGTACRFTELSHRLNNFYSCKDVQKRFEVYTPIENALCAVRSKRDKRFYRCRVERVPVNTRLAQVLMVDTGCREVVGSKDLFWLTEDDFITPYPYAMSVAVELINLIPEARTWSDESTDAVKQLLGVKSLMCVTEKAPPPVSELQYEESNFIPVALFYQTPQSQASCLGGYLVFREFAVISPEPEENCAKSIERSVKFCVPECHHPKLITEDVLKEWMSTNWKVDKE